jgi:hypothetical protein
VNANIVRDIASAWPAFFSDEPVDDVAMAEVVCAPDEAYTDLVERVAARLGGPASPLDRPWNVLISSEEASAARLAVGFWNRQRGALDPPDRVAEASRDTGATILRVAAARLPDADAMLSVLTAPWKSRFRRFVLLPGDERRVPDVLEWAAQVTDTYGHRLIAHLLRQAAPLDFCVLVESETDRHAPSLAVYGPLSRVTEIQQLVDV